MNEQNIQTKKNKKWILPVLVSVIAVIAVTVCVVIYNLPSNRRDRQLELAQKYMSELDYENAILAYRAAIEIDPKDEEAYLELAQVYIVMSDYASASQVLDEAVKNVNTEAVQAKIDELAILVADSEYDDNARLAEELELGREYLSKQDYEKAAEAYQEAVSIDPKCEEAYIGLIEALISLERYEEALAITEQALSEIESDVLMSKQDEIQQILESEIKTAVSWQDYDTILAAGNNYMVKENDKYGVVDFDGNVIIPCEYQYCLSGEEFFALGNAAEKGYDYTLYDADANAVFNNADYPEYFIQSYNEGVLQLMKLVPNGYPYHLDGDQVGAYVYLDVNNNFVEIYNTETADVADDFRIYEFYGRVGAEVQDWLSPYSHGYITPRRIYQHMEGLDHWPSGMGDKNGCFSNIVDGISAINCQIGADDEDFAYKNIGYMFVSDSSIGNDGWLLGYTYYYNGKPSWAFYNIDTKKMVFIHPSDMTVDEIIYSFNTYDFSWRWVDSGVRTVTANNMMLIDFEGDDTYSVWNVDEDRYVTDMQYSYVDLEAYGASPMLVSRDDRWGYVDDAFNELEWFDDASDFSGDYALVVKDGGIYVIDKELNVVSDMLEGVGVRRIENGHFVITKADGRVYICELQQ